MDDNRGVMLALALLLFWAAGIAFFFAFHPGGVKLSDGSDAQNPVDVLKVLLEKGGIGASATADAQAAQSTTGSPQ
jgi:hypothetical protein